jgi:hypothetical protein
MEAQAVLGTSKKPLVPCQSEQSLLRVRRIKVRARVALTVMCVLSSFSRTPPWEPEKFSARVGLIIAIVQSIIFMVLGFANLFFGTSTEKLTTMVQAGLASGYTELIDSILSITPENAFNSIERIVYVISGTVTMGYAAIKSDTGRQVRLIWKNFSCQVVQYPLFVFVRLHHQSFGFRFSRARQRAS